MSPKFFVLVNKKNLKTRRSLGKDGLHLRLFTQQGLLMLSSAVFAAFIMVVGLLYYFGLSGTYVVRDVLVSPEVLDQIDLSDYDTEGMPVVFNKIEFIHAQSSGKGWARYPLNQQSFESFYHLISNRKSTPHIADEMIERFTTLTPSTLTILVQTRDNRQKPEQSFIFQQIEFLDNEDTFRVQIHDAKEAWIYFTYPGIYHKVMEIFAPALT